MRQNKPTSTSPVVAIYPAEREREKEKEKIVSPLNFP